MGFIRIFLNFFWCIPTLILVTSCCAFVLSNAVVFIGENYAPAQFPTAASTEGVANSANSLQNEKRNENYTIEEQENKSGPNDFLEKRNIGRPNQWLRTNDDASHSESGSFVGTKYEHKNQIPWGLKRREDTQLLLPVVPLPSGGIGHFEDPNWLKSVKAFLSG